MRVIKFFSCFVVAVALWACGGGGGSPGSNPNLMSLLTTVPEGLVLEVGTTQRFQIRGGVPPYSAASPNPAVLLASIGGNDLVLTGVGSSVTLVSVVVSDSAGATSTVSVAVGGASLDQGPLFSNAKGGVTLKVGDVGQYVVGGGSPPYFAPVAGNALVASASLVEQKSLSIRGLSPGSTTITVTDSRGATLEIPVVVEGEVLTVSPATVTVAIGEPAALLVTGGLEPYSVISVNPAVATARVSGNLLTIFPLQDAVPAGGSATFIVQDADRKSVVVTAFVEPQRVGGITLAPSALTVPEQYSGPIVLQIGGVAVAPFKAYTSDGGRTSVTVSGSSVVIGAGAFGNRCVSETKSVTVLVVDGAGRSATGELTITETGGACPAP